MLSMIVLMSLVAPALDPREAKKKRGP
jgi:hypothetical protein